MEEWELQRHDSVNTRARKDDLHHCQRHSQIDEDDKELAKIRLKECPIVVVTETISFETATRELINLAQAREP